MPRAAVAFLICFATLLLCPPAHAATIPAGWGPTLQLGVRDDEGGAAALSGKKGLKVRYHYLSGGANTGKGWTTWSRGNGSFVPGFIGDSADHGFLPVFSLYQLRETAPGNSAPEETGILGNLGNVETMRAYFQDVRMFMQRAGETHVTTVLHIEPDIWGYIQRHSTGDDPATVPAQVSTTGLAELKGLPNDASGFAQAFVRLRDTYAKNVELAYHLSVWGTGEDIAYSDPSDGHIDDLAAQSVAFEHRLKARFDLIFAEFADRDSGYRQVVDGDNGLSWWDADDFRRQARYLGGVSATSGLRIVLWQIPLGNAAQSNTTGHYRDNRVETLLNSGSSAQVRKAYVDAGVIAMLFGSAIPGTTTQETDGGLFYKLAGAYAATGGVPLPGQATRPKGTKRRSPSAVRVKIRGKVGRPSYPRGSTVGVRAYLTAAATSDVLVAIQLFAPGATKPTFQVPFRAQHLRAGRTKRYDVRYVIPPSARRGGWKVKLGVFDPDWKTLLVWRETLASFSVR